PQRSVRSIVAWTPRSTTGSLSRKPPSLGSSRLMTRENGWLLSTKSDLRHTSGNKEVKVNTEPSPTLIPKSRFPVRYHCAGSQPSSPQPIAYLFPSRFGSPLSAMTDGIAVQVSGTDPQIPAGTNQISVVYSRLSLVKLHEFSLHHI